MMNFVRRFSTRYLPLSLVALVLLLATAQAQNVSESTQQKPVLSGGAASNDQIEQLKSKVDQLMLLIERQQRALAEMEKRLNGVEAKPQASSPVPASLKLGATEEPALRNEASTVVSSEAQPQSLEDRVKKVEDQVLKVGPLRFSGDFRLRLDAILRKPTEPPERPLAHVQNVRLRYRVRLNVDTDITPTLSFRGQLATGPINNPLTLDQDFTSTVAHHPIFINEAWIDYHPRKSVQLQGGRVTEIFADNSRFLFDDDLRFNGFNEKLILGHGSANIELRAGQYWFSNPNVAVVIPGSPFASAGAE